MSLYTDKCPYLVCMESLYVVLSFVEHRTHCKISRRIEFIYQSFTTPPFDEVTVEETPHGLALILDQKDIAGVCTYAGVGVEVGVNV